MLVADHITRHSLRLEDVASPGTTTCLSRESPTTVDPDDTQAGGIVTIASPRSKHSYHATDQHRSSNTGDWNDRTDYLHHE